MSFLQLQKVAYAKISAQALSKKQGTYVTTTYVIQNFLSCAADKVLKCLDTMFCCLFADFMCISGKSRKPRGSIPASSLATCQYVLGKAQNPKLPANQCINVYACECCPVIATRLQKCAEWSICQEKSYKRFHSPLFCFFQWVPHVLNML